VHFQDEDVFFLCPLTPDDTRIDDVVPSLAALPTKSSREKSRNNNPVLSAEHFNFLFQNYVFFRGPLSTADLGQNFGGAVLFVILVFVKQSPEANWSV
jgi:hypothetical protein